MSKFNVPQLLAVIISLITYLPNERTQAASSSSGLKTYCLFGNDKDCDEYWTPFPNMVSALVGYDVTQGNPFSTNSIEDPGFRQQIFNTTYVDPDGDYILASGVSVREYSMCGLQFENRAVTNMKGFVLASSKSSTSGLGIEVGIEAELGEDDNVLSATRRREGKPPTMISKAWQKSSEYEKVKAHIFRTRGAVVISEAQCITHKVDVSHFLTPGFFPQFIEVMRYLEKQTSDVKRRRAFKRFIRDYGTHYVSSAYMGAKVGVMVFYDNYEKLKFGRQRLFNCSAEDAKRLFKFKKAMKMDKSMDKDSFMTAFMKAGMEKRCPEIDNGNSDRSISFQFSSRPKENAEDPEKDWTELDGFKPIPVKFELTPIVNLFNRENLDERLGINSTEILDWLLPLYLDYCGTDENCNVRPESGCGFDDSCDFDENCVNDSRLGAAGFQCQSMSWADVANWPQISMQFVENQKLDSADGEDEKNAKNEVSSNDIIDLPEPESPKISWFFEKDVDNSGSLTLNELWIRYAENNWYNQRYQLVMEKLVQEADSDYDGAIDMQEYLKLHENHPWYSEQITFMLINTDNNNHLSRSELLEAAKISPDMTSLGFGERQLENLIDGLIAVGDKIGVRGGGADGKISFEEFVAMSGDIFVDNFAPDVFKKVIKRR